MSVSRFTYILSRRLPLDGDKTINPAARFHDGSPITAEDVAFTFATFMQQGISQFRVYYRGTKVTALTPYRVRFELPRGSKDMMMSLLQLPIIAKKFWQQRRFDEPLLQPPIGSGPYQISAWKLGQYITYQRIKNYWAADLPVNKGRYNDDNVVFEAFKAGAYDLRIENSAKKWASQYHGRNFSLNYIVKREILIDHATETTWLAFNNEKEIFKDIRLRKAISLVFDFNWLNRALFFNAYLPTKSYFQNTEYSAQGKADAEERRLLTPFKTQLPESAFTGDFTLPITDGSGYDRQSLLKALELLEQAGWYLKNQLLVNRQSGKPLQFELLARSGTPIEWAIPFRHHLDRLGIKMTIRQVDSSQFCAVCVKVIMI